MTTKELIKKLRHFENHYASILSDEYIDDELINEIVKRLEELKELKKYPVVRLNYCKGEFKGTIE